MMRDSTEVPLTQVQGPGRASPRSTRYSTQGAQVPSPQAGDPGRSCVAPVISGVQTPIFSSLNAIPVPGHH
jgi:hypothetical protein